MRRFLLLFSIVAFAIGQFATANDWPSARRDNRRSGVSTESVELAAFNQQWAWKSPYPPQTAWPGPARWDAYANILDLPDMRDYDHSFGVIAVGENVWFGSSVDDTLYCLAATTGEVKWTFTADGPIRMAPNFNSGRVYFGSDDGAVYCLSADTGELVWKYRQPTKRAPIINNGRLISPTPCRTNVLVEGGVACFGFGLLPWEESHLVAVDAATGEATNERHFHRTLLGETFEGPLALLGDRLAVCRGRVPPMIFDRSTGATIGPLATGGGGAGGSFLASTPHGELLHGPGNKTSRVVQVKPGAGKTTATHAGGRSAVAVEEGVIVAGEFGVRMVDAAGETKWRQSTAPLHNAIVVGDYAVAGGKGEVMAFRLKDGEPIWRRAVQGVASELALANGRLLVSTDAGFIYSFAAGGKAPESASPEVAVTPEPPKREVTASEPTRGLLSHWVFELGMNERARRRGLKDPDSFVGDLLRNNDARMTSRLSVQEAGAAQSLVFNGRGSVLVSSDPAEMKLPTKEMTVSAWVRVDQPSTWGGVIGFIQDNGPFERGWILGFKDDKFTFALKSKEGNGALTYLEAKAPYEKRRWYFVTGVYDGSTQQIYVNGELAGEAKTQQGAIDYPTAGFFEIGAYHDANEQYVLNGQVHAIRLHDEALSADEVARTHAAKAKWFPQPISLAAGPSWRFESGGKARVWWKTAKPSPTIVKTTIGKALIEDDWKTPKTLHQATLTDLPPRSTGSLVIETKIDGALGVTPAFVLDTHFDRSIEPVRTGQPLQEKHVALTDELLTRSKTNRGLALVVGKENLGVAFALIDTSEYRVVVLLKDETEVAAVRTMVRQLGLYGVRLTVRAAPTDWKQGLPTDCFNLVVGANKERGAELAIPGRGWIAHSADGEFKITQRAKNQGAGEWTHQYGLPDNAAFAGESLGGASKAGDLHVRWIGRPGPRMQPDRSGRKPSPLVAGGRLYVQGLHRIAAVDAANGSLLWGLEAPSLERFNIPRDSGNWCCDEEYLYAAIGSHVWKIRGESGEIEAMFPTVLSDQQDQQWDWSYLARTDDSDDREHLIGSAVKKGTAYTNFWGGAAAGWYDAVSGPATFKICSENLFSLDPESGATNWEYAGGLIINPTITIHNGAAYFVEARYPALKKETTRRLGGDDFWKEQYLVALDLATGEIEWEKKLVVDRGVAVFYMAAAKDKLVITTSNNKQYAVYGFSTKGGDEIWRQSFRWPRGAGDHGKAMSRPAIVGDTLYVRPKSLNLATGEISKLEVPLGGCGTYAATEHALIFRQSAVSMWSPEENAVTKWSRLRPGCWLSTVPAGGMVLSPEAGGGCSCGQWLEASIGFAPK